MFSLKDVWNKFTTDTITPGAIGSIALFKISLLKNPLKNKSALFKEFLKLALLPSTSPPSLYVPSLEITAVL